MLIVGAKGFAKEVLEILHQLGKTKNLVFFDNITVDLPDKLYNTFPILRSEEEVKLHFKDNGNSFVLGLGNPIFRKELCSTFESWGGKIESVISPAAQIGNYDVQIDSGAVILPNSIIANSTRIGKGCIIYYNAMITHDCTIGDFVELSPGATILGLSTIGSGSHIGSNATILPKINIGENVIVGAGAVVTKDIDSNLTVAGVPAVTLYKN